MYGVAFDEDRALVEAFLVDTPVSFSILWDRGGERLSAPFSITRLPTTVVVDRAGSSDPFTSATTWRRARSSRTRCRLLAE